MTAGRQRSNEVNTAYSRISTEISQKILSGEVPIGSKLTNVDIMRDHNIAAGTASEVSGLLRQKGFLEKVKLGKITVNVVKMPEGLTGGSPERL